MTKTRASLGLRSKTGRAIAVVLGGSIDSPRLLKRLDLTLTDSELREIDEALPEAAGQRYPEEMMRTIAR